MLQGLESGLDRQALVSFAPPDVSTDRQKENFSPTGEAPAGQRTIPKYQRKLRVADGVEGIERPLAKVEISAE